MFCSRLSTQRWIAFKSLVSELISDLMGRPEYFQNAKDLKSYLKYIKLAIIYDKYETRGAAYQLDSKHDQFATKK